MDYWYLFLITGLLFGGAIATWFFTKVASRFIEKAADDVVKMIDDGYSHGLSDMYKHVMATNRFTPNEKAAIASWMRSAMRSGKGE